MKTYASNEEMVRDIANMMSIMRGHAIETNGANFKEPTMHLSRDDIAKLLRRESLHPGEMRDICSLFAEYPHIEAELYSSGFFVISIHGEKQEGQYTFDSVHELFGAIEIVTQRKL